VSGFIVGWVTLLSFAYKSRVSWHHYYMLLKHDTYIESWYSKNGGLSYDEPKANTWHPLVGISYERESHHPLTAAVHKWNCMYNIDLLSWRIEALSLWPRQTYGSGCSCPPSPISLSHVTKRLRAVWHLEKTTRSSMKMLGGAGHYERRALSFWCLECCDESVSMEGATTRRRPRERERERYNLKLVYHRCHYDLWIYFFCTRIINTWNSFQNLSSLLVLVTPLR